MLGVSLLISTEIIAVRDIKQMMDLDQNERLLFPLFHLCLCV